MTYRGETAAARALAIELAARAVEPSHEWVVSNLELSLDPDGGTSGVPPALLETASRIGLRYLGRVREAQRGGRSFESAIYSDPSSRAYISLRTGQRVTSAFAIVSVFGDAQAIVTFSRTTPAMKSSARLAVRAGSEDLERDLAAHLAAVDAYPAAMVLPIEDGDDFLRALTIYYRHSISAEVVAIMKAPVTGLAGFLARWIAVLKS